MLFYPIKAHGMSWRIRSWHRNRSNTALTRNLRKDKHAEHSETIIETHRTCYEILWHRMNSYDIVWHITKSYEKYYIYIHIMESNARCWPPSKCITFTKQSYGTLYKYYELKNIILLWFFIVELTRVFNEMLPILEVFSAITSTMMEENKRFIEVYVRSIKAPTQVIWGRYDQVNVHSIQIFVINGTAMTRLVLVHPLISVRHKLIF